MYKRSSENWTKHLDFILLDAVCLVLALIFAYYAYYGSFSLLTWDIYRNILILLAFLDVFVAVLMNTMHHVMHRGYYIEFCQTLKQVLLVYAIEILLLFVTKWSGTYSRVILSLTAVFHLLLSYTTRLLWKRVVRLYSGQREKRSMILVCPEQNVKPILSRSNSVDEAGFSGVVLTDRNAEGETVCGLPVVADLSNAAHYICREWVDEVFIYAEMAELDKLRDREIGGENRGETGGENQRIIEEEDNSEPVPGTVAALVEQCRLMAIPIHIRVPLGGHNGRSFVENVNGFNVVTMTVNYASPLQLLLKRLMDILGGAVGSVLALLIVLVFGPIIRIKSPGPVLFRQERIGQNGKHFRIYKLRTMYLDAEERKSELLDQNRIEDGRMFKLDFDPRIIGNEILPDGTHKTGIGEWLRKYSLDEFPQFWNVLIGTMSLVGTRPPTVDEWEKYEYHHRARLSFRPGVTGMWQVSGRSKITDFEEVVRLDTEYIEHWSLGLDLRILLKTISAVFRSDGAM